MAFNIEMIKGVYQKIKNKESIYSYVFIKLELSNQASINYEKSK